MFNAFTRTYFTRIAEINRKLSVRPSYEEAIRLLAEKRAVEQIHRSYSATGRNAP